MVLEEVKTQGKHGHKGKVFKVKPQAHDVDPPPINE
jgi:hypothetical protein